MSAETKTLADALREGYAEGKRQVLGEIDAVKALRELEAAVRAVLNAQSAGQEQAAIAALLQPAANASNLLRRLRGSPF